MAENIRQRKKIDESNIQSPNDYDDRKITVDRHDHKTSEQSSVPLS